jgi:hypothetical protein
MERMKKEVKMSDYREVRTTQHEEGRTQRIATFKATQLIWLFLGILEVLIAMRIMFKLIGVNSGNLFAIFLYGVTWLFVAPFESLIGAPSVGNMVFEVSSTIAMIVYLLAAWGLERIVYAIFYRPRGPVTMRQTVVSDHNPAENMIQSSTTERIQPQGSSSVSQRTVSERTLPNTHNPDSF